MNKRWYDIYYELVEYRFKHNQLPTNFGRKGNFKLFRWLKSQKDKFKNKKLTNEQINLLKNLDIQLNNNRNEIDYNYVKLKQNHSKLKQNHSKLKQECIKLKSTNIKLNETIEKRIEKYQTYLEQFNTIKFSNIDDIKNLFINLVKLFNYKFDVTESKSIKNLDFNIIYEITEKKEYWKYLKKKKNIIVYFNKKEINFSNLLMILCGINEHIILNANDEEFLPFALPVINNMSYEFDIKVY